MNRMRKSGFLVLMFVVFASLNGMSTYSSRLSINSQRMTEPVSSRLIKFVKTHPKMTISVAIALILLAQKTNIRDRYENFIEKTFKMNAINTALSQISKIEQEKQIENVVDDVLREFSALPRYTPLDVIIGQSGVLDINRLGIYIRLRPNYYVAIGKEESLGSRPFVTNDTSVCNRLQLLSFKEQFKNLHTLIGSMQEEQEDSRFYQLQKQSLLSRSKRNIIKKFLSDWVRNKDLCACLLQKNFLGKPFYVPFIGQDEDNGIVGELMFIFQQGLARRELQKFKGRQDLSN